MYWTVHLVLSVISWPNLRLPVKKLKTEQKNKTLLWAIQWQAILTLLQSGAVIDKTITTIYWLIHLKTTFYLMKAHQIQDVPTQTACTHLYCRADFSSKASSYWCFVTDEKTSGFNHWLENKDTQKWLGKVSYLPHLWFQNSSASIRCGWHYLPN